MCSDPGVCLRLILSSVIDEASMAEFESGYSWVLLVHTIIDSDLHTPIFKLFSKDLWHKDVTFHYILYCCHSSGS